MIDPSSSRKKTLFLLFLSITAASLALGRFIFFFQSKELCQRFNGFFSFFQTWVELISGLIASQSLFLILIFLICDTEVEHGVHVPRVQLHRALVGRDRLPQLVEVVQRVGQVVVRHLGPGRGRHGLAVGPHRGLQVLRVPVNEPKVYPSICIIGVQISSSLEGADCSIQVTLFMSDVPKIVVGKIVIGIQFNGAVKISTGFFKILLKLKNIAHIVMSIWVYGI
mmetsp:Transcript_30041/g.51901  ORF Transcript_30041/g.51901 Transcript_30041/m.51901 type:complete len:224 (+) Transcript_30041:114-785(+)